MSSTQDRLVLLSAAVVESLWVYAALFLPSFMFGVGVSPISWFAAAALMLVSFGAARSMSIIAMPPMLPNLFQMLLGAVSVYIVLGTQVQVSGQPLDLGWIGALGLEEHTTNGYYVRSVALGGIYAALFWWRGGKLASTEFPSEHLSRMFKLGLIVLSIASVVDVFSSENYRTVWLAFGILAAGLTGLSVGHILPAANAQIADRSWTRVVVLSVGGIIGVGLLLSLLHRDILRLISVPIEFLVRGVVTVILWVVVFPVVYILSFVLSWLFGLLSLSPREIEGQEVGVGEGIQSLLQDLQEEATSTEPSLWVELLKWGLIALLVGVLLWFMWQAFNRKTRWRRVDQEGERETMTDDMDPMSDFANLLFGLLPDRFRRRRQKGGLRLPDDEPGIVEVFRIYARMLSAAESRGRPRRGDQTPTEYERTLGEVFPPKYARMATAAFDRACYGHLPESPERIAEMRQALDSASSKSKGGRPD